MRSEGVGSTKHGTAGLDGVKALKDHAEHGAGLHVRDQAGKKGFFLEIDIVCGCDVSVSTSGGMGCARTVFEMFFGGQGELGCDELEAAFLESGEDLADETAVDAVRLLGRTLWANLILITTWRDTLTMM